MVPFHELGYLGGALADGKLDIGVELSQVGLTTGSEYPGEGGMLIKCRFYCRGNKGVKVP